MALDVLQKFLTARLFDVAGEDARVSRLREAAADVTELIKASPQRTATFTMTAINGRAGADDPIVADVTRLLEKRWQSYAGAFSDERLPTVARAIVLHALAAAMGTDHIAACVALTARNLLPRIGVQSDRELWSELLADADRRLDAKAQRDWSLPSASPAVETMLDLGATSAIEAPAAPKTWLVSRMAAAAGPGIASGEAMKPPVNSNWPSNSGAQWSYEFAPIAGAAIAGALDSVSKALVEAINQRADGQGMADAITTYVQEATQAVARTAAGLERRTTLLWWKEALFSPTAGRSYRGLDGAAAAALVAIDASAQTGPFAPRMAEALVRETARSIDPATMSGPAPLAELCAMIAGQPSDIAEAIRAPLSQVHAEEGRAPLAALLGRDAPVDSHALASRLGVDGAITVAPEELALWLFRDLQAAAATPLATAKRKRGTRS